MGAVGPGIMFLGAGMQAYGSLREADAKARISEEEALLREDQATEVEAAAARDELIWRKEGEQIIGSHIAALSKSGFALKGSALNALIENRKAIEEEAAAIKRAGAFKAEQLRRYGSIERQIASETRTAGRISAGANLLTGFARFGNDSGWFDSLREKKRKPL